VTVVAYTYPLLGIFWSLLMFAGLALIVFFVIWCFIDNFRRADLSGWGKAGWTVVIVFIPLFGALMYMIARPT
jgi:Phospholipase_D-nuclease N-terminal